ncbi:hypothetical protein A5893_11065 [Pedobacter psychrophilus]|uniref:UspA domain-containing protein n=1 Tax=Pedobacter psychrophilus TaxID=1826909 RepID=A0A179DFB6_9SPHI|nr:hypothetical protein [Pedobacter psychrophilus]OAQ39199.1 hypothetical protein A5893_11065 [Pedobacter psychrophilus]
MKTILIPTDFEIKSLACIPTLVKKNAPEKLNILLTHASKISDSFADLLILSRRAVGHERISKEFINHYKEIQQTYANQINSIKIEFFYGTTVAVFENFLDHHNVDEIVHLEDYCYELKDKNSYQPSQLLKKCGRKLIGISKEELLKKEVEPADAFSENNMALEQTFI